MLNDRTARELIEEARMYTLCHENIVKLLAVVFEPGNYGIVMEYVRFGGLDEFIAIHGDKANSILFFLIGLLLHRSRVLSGYEMIMRPFLGEGAALINAPCPSVRPSRPTNFLETAKP